MVADALQGLMASILVRAGKVFFVLDQMISLSENFGPKNSRMKGFGNLVPSGKLT